MFSSVCTLLVLYLFDTSYEILYEETNHTAEWVNINNLTCMGEEHYGMPHPFPFFQFLDLICED